MNRNHPSHFGATTSSSITLPAGGQAVARPLALALSLVLAGGIVTPAHAAGERPDFPPMKFEGRSKGSEAVKRLGANMAKVAEWYGMTAERLTEILEKDPDASLDETGHVLFIDQFPAPPQEAGAIDGSGAVLDPGPYPLTDTFKLHSKPGAQRLIYLDFDGHTATATAWNSGTIVAPPFDLDGVVSTAFSNTELSRIQYIWQRVAEDYAPFDVDVTTEEPVADLLNRTSSTDQYYGTRAVITHSSIGVCTGCGGIAYLSIYNRYSSSNPTYYQPAWVLYDKLGPGNEKYVAEAISHEVGHNLGLSHDGTSTTGYYSGQGSGTTGWAPIMGVGYYQNTVQWSKGEYTGANNLEDDFAVIQSYGAPLKVDTIGDTKETARALGGTTSGGTVTVSGGGVIETRSDVDVYSFASGAGPVQITVDPGLRSPNMDIALELLDAAGNVVASANPATALNATISATLPAGAYYLKIDGVGYGDPATDGYSDYASVGRYVISGTYTARSAVAPVAVAAASPTSGYAPLPVGFSSNGSNDSDGTLVAYNWNFGDGTSAAEPSPVHTYSTPGTYDAVLTVTDSQGLTNTATTAIVVSQNPVLATLHVDNIVISSKATIKGKTTSYTCTANVTVKNYSGGAASGATVSGQWSSVSSGTASGLTNTSGVASIKSPTTSSRGTCTFTVNGISLSGWTYDSTQNVETTDSLTY